MQRRTLVAAIVVAMLTLAPALARASSPPGFATPTMADAFRPGFEPDLAIDTSPTAGRGQIYTSFPFGFSTTQSFIYRSNDAGQSFHLVEGNALGKPATCIGGGDTELQLDRVSGALYFSDLQGLTNFSNSTSSDAGRSWQTTCTAVNGTGVDRQWIGVDTNGRSTAVGPGAGDGRLYEDYDNVDQNSDQDFLLGNQLVMNESLDGVHYGSGCAAAGSPCPGPPAVISRDEGIPGNVVVDDSAASPYQHTVYAVHTGSANNSVIVSYCRGKAGDSTAAQVAADCSDPTQVQPLDPGHVNVNWHDSPARVPGQYLTGSLFASIAIDPAGDLYVVWAEYPTDASGTENGPGAIEMAVSTDGAQSWRGPFQVSPASLGNNVMPWVTVGDPGRVGVAWYGAPQAQEAGNYGPDQLDHGTWNVYYAQSLNALGATPGFSVAKVSDHQAKFGNISTQGLGGSPDRSLGDFMQVHTGVNGEAVISYVDDTSADRNPDYCQGCGETPSEAAGPVMNARQVSGASLFAADSPLKLGAPATGSVSDPAGKGYPDAFLSSGGTDTPATPNLDVAKVSVGRADASHLAVTMTTADPNLANDLAPSPALGGPVGEWIVRWAAPSYQQPGDGNIFYVGMQAGGSGGAPQFYSGTTCVIGTTHAKYFTYPTTTPIPGSISGASIRWTVPLSAVGSPAAGQGLYTITGLTATQLVPSASSASGGGPCPDQISGSGDENIPNLIDASPPFGYTVGSR
jgi:hypothetical protein